MSCENESVSPAPHHVSQINPSPLQHHVPVVTDASVTAGAVLTKSRIAFALETPSIAASESCVERVVIRDQERVTILNDIDDWTVQKLLGGLTDEPSCFRELVEAATLFGRLALHTPISSVQCSAEALDAAYRLSHEVTSWLWIDLSARMVVQWLPVFHNGLYQSEDGLTSNPEVVYTLLPPDWRLDSVSSCPNWYDVIKRRADANQSRLLLNTQEVIWGSKLLFDWVELVWEFRKRVGDEIWQSTYGGKSDWLQRQLISIFLKTERADLGGDSPLNTLSASRAFVDQACQYRRELWVHYASPPAARKITGKLKKQARFGSVQNRLLLEMFEFLLTKIQNSPWTTPRSNLAEWQACVEKWQQKFLSEVPAESAWSRQELIELETAFLPIPLERVPWNSSPPQLTPIPLFQEIHGFDDLANSLTNLAQASPTDSACDTEPSQAATLRLEAKKDSTDPEMCTEEFVTVWKHSYLNWDAEWPVEACYAFLVMRLSFLVSEILMELQQADDRWHAEELIDRFALLQRAGEREKAQEFEKAANVFCDLLEELTRTHPELVPRLADLQSRLWEQTRKLIKRVREGE